MKNNGFTLVELLAVIVILAIIALIAVPIVLGIINDSKKSSEEESVKLYTDTVEKAITRKQLNNPNFNPDKCEIKTDGNLECFSGTTSLGTVKVSMKGQLPSRGEVIINNNKISYKNIVLNDKIYYEKEVPTFSIKDKVSYNNVTYYVIEDSGTSNDTVKLLKENPLLKTEIDALVIEGVNVIENNSYGNVIYGSSTDYSTSTIKQIVDAWATTAIKSGDSAKSRLITKDEIENNFEFEEFDYRPCGACATEIGERIETEWMYNENYYYWGMTSVESSNPYSSTMEIIVINNDGRIISSGPLAPNGSIRPVLELNKSAEITKLES